MAVKGKINLGPSYGFIIRCATILGTFIIGGMLYWYTTCSNPHPVRTKVLKVEQITRTQGDKESFYTSVDYYVHTESGTFSIPTSGLNAYPHLAGVLEEGATYTITISGISVPFLGIYERVIKVD